MKQFLLLIIGLGMSLISSAQYGTAEDFMVTDIEGNEHHLYAILDEGKPVILDVSATWCGPCWNLHQSHSLEMLHTMYGPEGTDQIRVLFYEGDANTTLADLQGTGSRTLGNWLEGASYPFINESPISIDLQIYAPLGFPTVNLIRPSDREITDDMYNYNFQAMVNAINEIITLGSPTAVEEVVGSNLDLSIYPNPAFSFIELALDDDAGMVAKVINMAGQVVVQQPVTSADNRIYIGNLSEASYIVQLMKDQQVIRMGKFVKQ